MLHGRQVVDRQGYICHTEVEGILRIGNDRSDWPKKAQRLVCSMGKMKGRYYPFADAVKSVCIIWIRCLSKEKRYLALIPTVSEVT